MHFVFTFSTVEANSTASSLYPFEGSGEVEESPRRTTEVDEEGFVPVVTASPSPSPNVTTKCRGDDMVPCGNTGVYICEIQQCDGKADCPGGDDEVNCPPTGTSC